MKQNCNNASPIGLHDLLSRCRDVGIEAAFTELAQLANPSEKPSALKRIEAFHHHTLAISYLNYNQSEITQSEITENIKRAIALGLG